MTTTPDNIDADTNMERCKRCDILCTFGTYTYLTDEYGPDVALCDGCLQDVMEQ